MWEKMVLESSVGSWVELIQNVFKRFAFAN